VKDARPTSGKVLLALFAILGDLESAAFLDLFAGTGRVGLEALRRGAASVVFAETLQCRARAIGREVPEASRDRAAVLALELRRALAWLAKRGLAFDIVFADPPYGEGWGASLLGVKGLDKTVKKGGLLVVEHASREKLNVVSPWGVADARTYGETALTFLKPETASS
jgi:16S rRNA (guanine(966)-N(2))-methyltransferase RsmD